MFRYNERLTFAYSFCSTDRAQIMALASFAAPSLHAACANRIGRRAAASEDYNERATRAEERNRRRRRAVVRSARCRATPRMLRQTARRRRHRKITASASLRTYLFSACAAAQKRRALPQNTLAQKFIAAHRAWRRNKQRRALSAARSASRNGVRHRGASRTVRFKGVRLSRIYAAEKRAYLRFVSRALRRAGKGIGIRGTASAATKIMASKRRAYGKTAKRCASAVLARTVTALTARRG